VASQRRTQAIDSLIGVGYCVGLVSVLEPVAFRAIRMESGSSSHTVHEVPDSFIAVTFLARLCPRQGGYDSVLVSNLATVRCDQQTMAENQLDYSAKKGVFAADEKKPELSRLCLSADNTAFSLQETPLLFR